MHLTLCLTSPPVCTCIYTVVLVPLSITDEGNQRLSQHFHCGLVLLSNLSILMQCQTSSNLVSAHTQKYSVTSAYMPKGTCLLSRSNWLNHFPTGQGHPKNSLQNMEHLSCFPDTLPTDHCVSSLLCRSCYGITHPTTADSALTVCTGHNVYTVHSSPNSTDTDHWENRLKTKQEMRVRNKENWHMRTKKLNCKCVWYISLSEIIPRYPNTPCVHLMAMY